MEPGDGGFEPIGSLAEFAAAIAAHETAHAHLAREAARLAEVGDWALDGSLTMNAWLREHARMLDTDAAALLRQGRFLREFEALGAAAVGGTLSAGQVTLLRRSVTRTTEPILREHQHELTEILAPLDIRQTAEACAAWRTKADALLETEPAVEPEAELAWSTTNGRAYGRFALTEAGTIQLETAIQTATTFEGADDRRSATARRADALTDILAFFNANHDKAGTPRHRPHAELVLHGRPEPEAASGAGLTLTLTRAGTIDGELVDLNCAEALTCDCVLHRVLKSGSALLDYGRAVRSVPISLFRAVAQRDGGCRFPGCDRRVAWTEAHHIVHWMHGGPTTLENLGLFCSRHHHRIHLPGWKLQLLADATLVITTPDGRTLTSQPRGSPPTIERRFTTAA